jgi:hypothetical protein
MARHYTTREFFRQMPNALLSRYFIACDALAEMDLSTPRDTHPDQLFAAWLGLPDARRKFMDAEFREIFALSCEKGWCAIRDEARWHLEAEPEQFADFMEKLSALPSHADRAMVAFLDHKECWQGATMFYHADTLTYWRKRKGLPKVPAFVHEDGRQDLAKRIREYFHRTEGRGKNCVVEAYRRGDLDYFFAYPEDYSQQSIEWVNGDFARRPHNPAFEVVYVYHQNEGTLDLNFRGSYKAIEPLQGMFAEAILKLGELPPDPKDERVYDLNPLRQRGFQFVYELDSGIERVVVRKMRLSSRIKQGNRITVEADGAKNANALYDLLDEVGKELPLGYYNVTQVEISATMKLAIDKPQKQVTFRITYPNSCSLKYDDFDLRLREMLTLSGIEPKTPVKTAGDELESAEA